MSIFNMFLIAHRMQFNNLIGKTSGDSKTCISIEDINEEKRRKRRDIISDDVICFFKIVFSFFLTACSVVSLLSCRFMSYLC